MPGITAIALWRPKPNLALPFAKFRPAQGLDIRCFHLMEKEQETGWSGGLPGVCSTCLLWTDAVVTNVVWTDLAQSVVMMPPSPVRKPKRKVFLDIKVFELYSCKVTPLHQDLCKTNAIYACANPLNRTVVCFGIGHLLALSSPFANNYRSVSKNLPSGSDGTIAWLTPAAIPVLTFVSEETVHGY